MTEPDVQTLADLPFHVSGRFPKPILLQRCRADGTDDLSSREVFDRVRDLSLGLTGLGIEPGDRVALMSESRPDWTIADLAILTARAVTVPLYPTLAVEQVRGILADSGARLVIVSDAEQVAKVIAVRGGVPALESVVVMDRADGEGGEAVVLSMTDVAARGHRRLMTEDGLGRRFREATAGGDPEAVATIIYTSGTTGEPKGVMLTHANILSNVRSTGEVIPMNSEDTALSFLPLSHSLERTVLYKYLYDGVTVAFAESLDTIGRDLRAVRPTITTGVPRVYEKVQARVLESVAHAPPVRRRIFGWALGVGGARALAQQAGRAAPLARPRPGSPGRPLGVPEDPRRDRGAAAADRVGRRAARAWPRRVLLGDWHADRRGLRVDGDVAGADHQPARRRTGRHGGEGDSGCGVAHRG